MKTGKLSLLFRLSTLVAGMFTTGIVHADYSYLSRGAPGTVVTTQGVLQTAANQLTTLIENRVRRARDTQGAQVASYSDAQGSGISAGDPFSGFAVWANVGYDHLNNSLTSTDYDGHITTITAGFDSLFNCYNAIGGLAVAWEQQNLDTTFNGGTQDADGWAIMPYLSFMFDEEWALSFLVGYESLNYTLTRVNVADAPGLALAFPTFTGSPSGDRYFGLAELTFQRFVCQWDFGAQAALAYLHQSTGSYNEVSTLTSVFIPERDYHLGRFKLGGTLGYFLNDTFEPYVRAAFLWDFSQTDIVFTAPVQPFPAPGNSDTAGLFGIGLNIFSCDNVLFNVDVYTEQFRDDFHHWGALANFRVLL